MLQNSNSMQLGGSRQINSWPASHSFFSLGIPNRSFRLGIVSRLRAVRQGGLTSLPPTKLAGLTGGLVHRRCLWHALRWRNRSFRPCLALKRVLEECAIHG